ncbi:SDR family oxidoreductase [Streptomyces sp. NPDC004546]|uniref:SDR family oxidoreductase n=1 Tax=unclassified Streptomyces TaxID=2593676 RepID=UPI0033AF8A0F
MDLGLRGRAFLVTAATRGLGFAAAQQLTAEGARVVVTGRTQESVDKAVVALGGTEVALGLVADNGDPGTARMLVDACVERFGQLDGVLISAGGPPAGRVAAIEDAQWRSSFESVFLGAIRLARAAAEVLVEGGVIGFVLSGTVRQPALDLAVSNGLRPGLAMAAKGLADELGPRGVRVVGLLPNQIDTERVQELDSLTGDRDATRARNEAVIPLRRYGRPEEFGRVATFLLSPAASYLTGIMVPVDGGALRGL